MSNKERQMKDFTYHGKIYSLEAYACRWLMDMGLKETRWILDTAWFLDHYNGTVTYHDWIRK